MPEQNSKPVFVLVHGAWHRPSHLKYVTKILEDAGYTVSAPALPSVRSHGADTGTALEDDTIAIVEAIRQLTGTGKNVVLLMHSYAGFCGSDAAAIICEEQRSSSSDSSHGKIIQLVFLAAYVVDKGESAASIYNIKPGDPPIAPLSAEFLLSPEPTTRFYNGTPKELADEATAMVEPIAVSAFMGATRYNGWRDYGIPVKYVACKDDQTLLPSFQSKYIDDLSAAGLKDYHSEWLESDHSPFLHMPEKVAQLLLDCVEHA